MLVRGLEGLADLPGDRQRLIDRDRTDALWISARLLPVRGRQMWGDCNLQRRASPLPGVVSSIEKFPVALTTTHGVLSHIPSSGPHDDSISEMEDSSSAYPNRTNSRDSGALVICDIRPATSDPHDSAPALAFSIRGAPALFTSPEVRVLMCLVSTGPAKLCLIARTQACARRPDSPTVQLASINARAGPLERRSIRHPTLDDIVERWKHDDEDAFG